MIHPLFSTPGNLKLTAKKNKEEDEKLLLDSRGSFSAAGRNRCKFPTKVYVINKPERVDRWEKFCSSNSLLFQNFQVQKWEASSPSLQVPEVRDAIFQSYTSCLGHTLKEEESIIIMEDDAYLVPGALEKISQAWKDLPEDWDVLIGNHYFFGEIQILTDHIAKPVTRASTINFGIFRRSILPKLESNLHLKEKFESIKDFDHYLTSEMTSIQNYTIWPMISREFPSYSDHKGRFLDSSEKIIGHAHKYKFIDSDEFYPSLSGW